MKSVSSQAYPYFFSRMPLRAERETLGSYHGAEIPDAFTDLDTMNWALEETDIRLSRMMSDYWLNFASTGGSEWRGPSPVGPLPA